ncbi:hypothetical protein N644_1411 [Lactiplantibacillus paraplantarum]|uniref:hypothetical protein n=1 Tax=Lactiplantibacillus paraplantarum TaxID=60520 RepID=UPI0003AE2DFA|nr:hypothetical protein [Lactiplantibacillus paraplantarum]ERL44391.1 hypothetical protein N644_1411 [Lactiplantibacillus paraplantarum]KRL49485.1 hypothetical protein FD48_GL000773 [Lactiplantibacillus paraplantarum DSM 10667]
MLDVISFISVWRVSDSWVRLLRVFIRSAGLALTGHFCSMILTDYPHQTMGLVIRQ